MKKILILLLISPLLLATSCDDDDNNTPQNAALTGRWKLVNISGGIQGQDFDVPNGTITWTFNNNNMVQVVNNNPVDSNVEDFFETGTYTYQHIASEVSATCPQLLRVNNVDLGCKHTAGNTMTLTQTESDGYVLTLMK